MPTINHEPPKDYCCPITTELMADPVMAADGHSYERSAIMEWLATNNTSPLTREVLEHTQVIANRTLKKAIQTFIEQNQAVYQMKFIEAMQQGDYDAIWYLEKLGVNLKTIDDKGWSLSHYAVSRGSLAEIKTLSEKGLLSNDNTATATVEFYLPEFIHTIQEAEATITALQEKSRLLSTDRYYYLEDKDKQSINTLENEVALLKNALEPARRNVERLKYEQTLKRYDDTINYTTIDDDVVRQATYLKQQTDQNLIASAQSEVNKIQSRLNSLQPAHSKLVQAREKAQTELKDIKNQIDSLTALINSKVEKTYVNLTPLHLAINNHAVPIVQFFLDQGFSLEDKDSNGATLLFWSMYKNDAELFNLFIEKGANLEALDNEGNTLLHVAARYADKAQVESLLSRGCNHSIKNNAGQTPVDLARQHGKIAIADYITQQGEQLWQNMPKRLLAQEQRILAQDQRIGMLEQQINLLQEQLATLLNHGPQQASRDSLAMAVQSSSSVAKPGLFNHRQNYTLNKVTADVSASNTSNDATSSLAKFN